MKVTTLVEQERSEREAARRRQEEEEREVRERAEREEQARIQRQHEMMEDLRKREAERLGQAGSDTTPKPSTTSQPFDSQFSERTGLCVICQDEDANIAVVDCG